MKLQNIYRMSGSKSCADDSSLLWYHVTYTDKLLPSSGEYKKFLFLYFSYNKFEAEPGKTIFLLQSYSMTDLLLSCYQFLCFCTVKYWQVQMLYTYKLINFTSVYNITTLVTDDFKNKMHMPVPCNTLVYHFTN